MDELAIGTGRSKEVEKRVVAKMILEHLCLRGYRVPAEFASRHAIISLMDQAGLPTHSYVVLVRKLCKRFRLDQVEYETSVDPTGEPQFTVMARIGDIKRIGTGSTSRIAENFAAEQIYRYLRTILHAHNFNEDRVLFRAYEKAMAPSSDEDNTDDDSSDEDTTDEDTIDDQLSNQEELQVEAAAAPTRTRRNGRNNERNNERKNKTSAAEEAVQATIKLELEPKEPEEESHEVGSTRLPRPLSPDAGTYRRLTQRVAMKFISRTIFRLRI